MDAPIPNEQIYSETQKSKTLAELALHHPLFSGKVLLPTSPIGDLYKTIQRIVVLRETGRCFAARSGVGKTSALEMVEIMIQTEFPQLAVFKHDTHNQQLPSIRAFFKHFLATVGHTTKKGETYDLRERLVNTLIDRARIAGMNMVLLLIDEANGMHKQDFIFLKDVYNDLGKGGVQLVTVLMGQAPDLTKVIENLQRDGRLDLIGRFAMRMLTFRAFNSLEDIKTIFEGIDTAKFPVDSETTWTEFFFPKAYLNGFRLINEAEPFMTAIKGALPKTYAGSVDFPARQMFVAIRAMIIDHAGMDAAKMRLPTDAWRNAVAYAQLKEAMLLINAHGHKTNTEIEQ